MGSKPSLDGINPVEPDDPDTERANSKRKSLLVAGGSCLGVWLLFDSAAWLENGGQFYSLVGAIKATALKIPVVEIDDQGLQLPIMLLLTIATTLIWSQSNWKFEFGRNQDTLIFMLIVMFGALFIDICFGEDVIDSYMTSHQYVRCRSRDHMVGHGKGEVWFIDYVRNPVSCPGPTGYPKVERFDDDESRLEQQLRAANKARNEGR